MLRFLVAALALGIAAQASAGEGDEGEGIAFGEALAAAAEHPEVRGALAAAGVLERARVGGLNGFASLGAQAGRVDGEFQGRLTPLYSFILMRQGKAAKDTVAARRHALEAEARAALLERQLAVAEAWIALHSIEALEARLAEEARLLEEWARTLERALRGGVVTAAELVQLEAEAAELAQRRARRETDRAQARFALARSLAMPSAQGLRAEGAPPDVVPCEVADARELASRLPALALARRRTEDAAAFGRFDRSTFWPGQLGVGAEIPLDALGALGVVELQLPMLSAQRAVGARHGAEVARLERFEEAALREAEQLVTFALDAARLARAAATRMREVTLPTHEALHETARRRLAVGEATVFEVLTGYRRLLATREQSVLLEAAERWARVRLELLVEAAGGCTPGEEAGAR